MDEVGECECELFDVTIDEFGIEELEGIVVDDELLPWLGNKDKERDKWGRRTAKTWE